MVNREKYCAARLRILEDEQFLAVGDARWGRLWSGAVPASLPDLLSVKGELLRIREVKFKLEHRLVEKALRQLRSGIESVVPRFPGLFLDRVELAIALQGRALKPAELPFVGRPLGVLRHELLVDGAPRCLEIAEQRYPVSVALL